MADTDLTSVPQKMNTADDRPQSTNVMHQLNKDEIPIPIIYK